MPTVQIVRAYLPTCNHRELLTLFGPIERYLAESPEGDALVEYAVGPDGLEERPLSVS